MRKLLAVTGVLAASSALFISCSDETRLGEPAASLGQDTPAAQAVSPAEVDYSPEGHAGTIAAKSLSAPGTQVEAFDDPLGGWKTRFMGLNSNLVNYYIATNSCWGDGSGSPDPEDCRGNNIDGLWIHDGDRFNGGSYIRFGDAFGRTLTSFALDIGSHNNATLIVYDSDLNQILNAPIPRGCSNCAYPRGGGGSNVYHSFSVTSSNGIGGFDIHGSGVEGNVGIDNIVVTAGPSNRDPDADAGADQTVECAGAGTDVALDGSGSSDPDGDDLSYSWSEGGTELATGVSPTVSLSHGSHTITLTVDDGSGGTDTDDVTVDIVDTTDPDVSIAVDPGSLWPPNHEMVLLSTDITASDICDDTVGLSVEVTSNEPEDGTGDGDASPDWDVVDNGDGTFDVRVRAERSGNGDGRIYTITATATDDTGNSASASAEVTVAHDQGGGNGKGKNK